jgi:hypothetical protein
VWMNPVSGRLTCAGGVILKSEERGRKIRMRGVLDVLAVMRTRWPNMVLVFDRNWGGGLIAEEFEEDHGIPVIDHGQGTPMEFASMLLGEMVSGHALDLSLSDEALTHMYAATARKTYYGKRWRLEAPRDHAPIDFASALAMGVNAAKQAEANGINVEDYRIEGL